MGLDHASRSSRPWLPSVLMSMMRSFRISCLGWTPSTSSGSNRTPSHTIFSLPAGSRLTTPANYRCSTNERGDQKSASSPMIISRNSPPSAVCSRPLDSISKKDGSIPLWGPRPPPCDTASRPKGRPGLSRKKIVDVFLVHPIDRAGFPSPQHDALRQTVSEVVQLLDTGQFEEARQYVNRRLVERLDKQRSAFTGLLDTVQITFDNSQSPTDTIMDIQSDDTPAFLYALANALAMRNIYITKAQIECDGAKLHDRFFVRNRDGQKLTRLRRSAATTADRRAHQTIHACLDLGFRPG